MNTWRGYDLTPLCLSGELRISTGGSLRYQRKRNDKPSSDLNRATCQHGHSKFEPSNFIFHAHLIFVVPMEPDFMYKYPTDRKHSPRLCIAEREAIISARQRKAVNREYTLRSINQRSLQTTTGTSG